MIGSKTYNECVILMPNCSHSISKNSNFDTVFFLFFTLETNYKYTGPMISSSLFPS